MHIALNLLYVLPGEVGGTESYARGLVRALSAANPADLFSVYLSREAAAWPLPESDNVRRVICPVRATDRRGRYLWEQVHLPRTLRHDAPDLLHSLGYVGPLVAGRPHVVTVHDCNFLQPIIPMARDRRFVLRFLVRLLGATAERIITVSDFSASELNARMRIPWERLVVTHEAPDAAPALDPLDAQRQRQAMRLPDKYLLGFSSASPHKNVPGLVAAYAAIAGTIEHDLVLVGHGSASEEIQRLGAGLGVSARLHCTGFVPEETLDAVLHGASALAFPSFYEGFGLPVLEAQAAGVPVLCSTAAALPEVAGEGALYFDPHNPAAIAAAIHGCLSDEATRLRLIAAGERNLRRFSWATTAATTYRVYQQVLEQGAPKWQARGAPTRPAHAAARPERDTGNTHHSTAPHSGSV